MSVLHKFSGFVMDLYENQYKHHKTPKTQHPTTHQIIIKIDTSQEILLWFNDDKIYPEIVHNFEENNAIDLGTVLEILNIVERYEELEE